MKKYLPLLFLLWFAGTAMAKTYSIIDFGAEADGKTLNTIAFQKAINACTPGDTVYVPSGRYLTGTIHLKSNLTLYIDRDAFLLGSANLNDYESYTLEGQSKHYLGVIYTSNAANVTIAGNGTIEGNSPVFFDFTKTTPVDTLLTRYTRQKGNFRSGIAGLADGPVTAYERPQHMIVFAGCSNVRVQNIALVNAPFRALCIGSCKNVKLQGIKIWSGSINVPDASGINISGSRHVAINGCEIRSGNDAIAIAGFDTALELPGVDASQMLVSDSITITNCTLQSSCSGISVASVNKSQVKNVYAANVNITNSGRGIGLVLRGEGSLENMAFNDMYIDSRLHTGSWTGNGEPVHLSAVPGTAAIKPGNIKNISFSNVACTGENHILIYGSKESVIQDVRFDDVVFKLRNSNLNDVAGGNIDLRGNADAQQNLFAASIPAVMARYVSGLFINNIKVTWGNGLTQPYFTDGMEISNFKSFKLTNYSVKASPSNTTAHAISLIDGSLAMVDAGDVHRTRVTDLQPEKKMLSSKKRIGAKRLAIP